jgi:hypothetical protein
LLLPSVKCNIGKEVPDRIDLNFGRIGPETFVASLHFAAYSQIFKCRKRRPVTKELFFSETVFFSFSP